MPTPEIKENEIYKAEELSELFDIPIQGIRTLIKKGHIKGIKIGKRWYIKGKSLLDLFEDNPKETTEEPGRAQDE